MYHRTNTSTKYDFLPGRLVKTRPVFDIEPKVKRNKIRLSHMPRYDIQKGWHTKMGCDGALGGQSEEVVLAAEDRKRDGGDEVDMSTENSWGTV